MSVEGKTEFETELEAIVQDRTVRVEIEQGGAMLRRLERGDELARGRFKSKTFPCVGRGRFRDR
jgi:hypothetical protein